MKFTKNLQRISLSYCLTAMSFGYLILTVGCATDLTFQKATGRNEEGAIIAHVPFVSQEPDFCGPATLAMIFNFWGLRVTQEEIADEIYSPKLKGTLSIEMALYAMQKGFEADVYSATLEDLKTKIRAGFPLIVSHREKPEKELVHYLVVFGFDDDKKIIFVHSGKKQHMTMGYQTFLTYWRLADNLTFFIRPN